MLLLALRFQQCRQPGTELDHIRHRFQLPWRHRHLVVADQRSKPLPRVIFTSDLGVVRKHCRQHTALGVIGSHVRRAGAETTILVQRHTATIFQGRELVHVEVHAPVVLTRQLHPRAQANDRGTHRASYNATSLRALPVDPATPPALTGTQPEDPGHRPQAGRCHKPHTNEPERQATWPGHMRQSTADQQNRYLHAWLRLASAARPPACKDTTRGVPPLPISPTPADSVRHASGCLQPVLLRGRVDHIDGATGELLHRYTTVHEPGEVLPIACKTRRASGCPPCAEVYRAVTY
jgi:hypothetical protein